MLPPRRPLLRFAHVQTDPTTGGTTGIAYLIFKNPGDAKAAQEAINGLELVGKGISVSLVPEAPQQYAHDGQQRPTG
jgi:RNA recognition motif-containing protein